MTPLIHSTMKFHVQPKRRKQALLSFLLMVGFEGRALVSCFRISHFQERKHKNNLKNNGAMMSGSGDDSMLFCGSSSFSSKFWAKRRQYAVSASVSNEVSSEASSASSSSAPLVSPETEAIIHDFISHVQESIRDQTFVSLTLRGPKLPRRKKKGKQQQQCQEKERLRGCIRQVQGRLVVLKNKRNKAYEQEQSFLQVTIKYHGATDVAKNWKIDGDDQVARGLSSLLLSDGDDMVLSEWGERGLHPCSSELGIQGGEVCTTRGTWELDVRYRKKSPRLWKRRVTTESAAAEAVVPTTHDRAKQVPLSPDAPFLQALGLTKADGKPRPGMSSKLKQCQKFVEIVGGLVETCIANNEDACSISSVDMGCGRGYLTFSLHSHLMDKYGKCNGKTVKTCGIDMRPKLVREITGIARSLGTDYEGLTFEEGTIESALSTASSEKCDTSLDILIALHACDTATDDALWSGIQGECDVLVVAPCCHKEVRRQLDPYIAKAGLDHPLADVLRHNIYRERMAETVTDSVRALLLELANYNVQVFEFIGGEHTSKNVMITATKRQRARTSSKMEKLRHRLRALSALHGIRKQRLAGWMGEQLSEDESPASTSRLSSKRMPPLTMEGTKEESRKNPPDLLRQVRFRNVMPGDIPSCFAIEEASYPAGEAASKSSLQYRQQHASRYFRCAVLGEEENEIVIGFVCSMRCIDFEHECMSTHESSGPVRAIDSVVVDEKYRHQGLATAMLKDYIATVKGSNDGIEKLVLLAKRHLLGFYVNCGFSILRPSAILHGEDLWYELEMDIRP